MNWFSHDGKVVPYAYDVLAGRCLLALYAKNSKFDAKSRKWAAKEISGFVPEFRRDRRGAEERLSGFLLDL